MNSTSLGVDRERARWRAAQRFRRDAERRGEFRCTACVEGDSCVGELVKNWFGPWDPRPSVGFAHLDGPDRYLEVHHIIPVHDGGTDDPDNLVLLCRPHHVLATRISRVMDRRGTETRYRGPKMLRGLLGRISEMERELRWCQDIADVRDAELRGVLTMEEEEEELQRHEFLAAWDGLDLLTWRLRHRYEIEGDREARP